MVFHRLRRWYVLHLGAGRAMREHGAEISSCPHCERETPVYRSTYDGDDNPVSFTVCLWCQGLIEYGSGVDGPRPPFAPDPGVRQSGDPPSPPG